MLPVPSRKTGLAVMAGLGLGLAFMFLKLKSSNDD
jgi:hypothetical protein